MLQGPPVGEGEVAEQGERREGGVSVWQTVVGPRPLGVHAAGAAGEREEATTMATAMKDADGGGVCACGDLVCLFVDDVDGGDSGCESALVGPWLVGDRSGWLADRGLGSRGAVGSGSTKGVRWM